MGAKWEICGNFELQYSVKVIFQTAFGRRGAQLKSTTFALNQPFGTIKPP
jgi:hypothetical protein